jgi:hypothetical protein
MMTTDGTRNRRLPSRATYAAALLLLMLATGAVTGPAKNVATAPADSSGDVRQGYRIDQPGTITFTVGVKISGKVEKPQVMIFLPKEKTLYREEVFTRSFKDELMQPLPFTPID